VHCPAPRLARALRATGCGLVGALCTPRLSQ
jgi:hypothetical protein